jgi:hypothetical protein
MQPTQRLFFLDWLRIVVFGLLVFFHVGMYYVTWAYHVKSQQIPLRYPHYEKERDVYYCHCYAACYSSFRHKPFSKSFTDLIFTAHFSSS